MIIRGDKNRIVGEIKVDMNLQKQKFWRSKKYLAWIRTLQCGYCITQTTKTEPHHIIGVGNLSGMGMKAPDWTAMPLCTKCHSDLHDGYSDMYHMQWEMIVRTLGRAIDEDVLTEHLIPF